MARLYVQQGNGPHAKYLVLLPVSLFFCKACLCKKGLKMTVFNFCSFQEYNNRQNIIVAKFISTRYLVNANNYIKLLKFTT